MIAGSITIAHQQSKDPVSFSLLEESYSGSTLPMLESNFNVLPVTGKAAEAKQWKEKLHHFIGKIFDYKRLVKIDKQVCLETLKDFSFVEKTQFCGKHSKWPCYGQILNI